jgi:Phosphatidate cytidylyltransferase, mitochondrial
MRVSAALYALISAELLNFRPSDNSTFISIHNCLFMQGIPQMTSINHNSSTYSQDTSAAAKRALIRALPSSVTQHNTAPWIPTAVAAGTTTDKYISRRLAQIVSSSSRWQGVKGVITAGVTKSVLYAAAKVKKSLV